MKIMYRWSSDYLLPFIMTALETSTVVCGSYTLRLCSKTNTAHLDHVTPLPELKVIKE